MKVYVITEGEYSDYHICGVTLDKSEAKKAAELYNACKYCSTSIEEYDTEDVEKINCGLQPFRISFDGNGNIRTVERDDYNYFIEETIFNIKNEVLVKLYAKDKESAIKIAAEKRAMFLAHKLGID